jgi:hypothetical protein
MQLTSQGKPSSETFNIDDKLLFELVFDESWVHFRHQRTILHLIISLKFCFKMASLLNLEVDEDDD